MEDQSDPQKIMEPFHLTPQTTVTTGLTANSVLDQSQCQPTVQSCHTNVLRPLVLTSERRLAPKLFSQKKSNKTLITPTIRRRFKKLPRCDARKQTVQQNKSTGKSSLFGQNEEKQNNQYNPLVLIQNMQNNSLQTSGDSCIRALQMITSDMVQQPPLSYYILNQTGIPECGQYIIRQQPQQSVNQQFNHIGQFCGGSVKMDTCSVCPNYNIQSIPILQNRTGIQGQIETNVKPVHNSSILTLNQQHQVGIPGQIETNVKSGHISSTLISYPQHILEIPGRIETNVKPAYNSSTLTSNQQHQAGIPRQMETNMKPDHSSSILISYPQQIVEIPGRIETNVKPTHNSSTLTSNQQHQLEIPEQIETNVKPAHNSSTLTLNQQHQIGIPGQIETNAKPDHNSSTLISYPQYQVGIPAQIESNVKPASMWISYPQQVGISGQTETNVRPVHNSSMFISYPQHKVGILNQIGTNVKHTDSPSTLISYPQHQAEILGQIGTIMKPTNSPTMLIAYPQNQVGISGQIGINEKMTHSPSMFVVAPQHQVGISRQIGMNNSTHASSMLVSYSQNQAGIVGQNEKEEKSADISSLLISSPEHRVGISELIETNEKYDHSASMLISSSQNSAGISGQIMGEKSTQIPSSQQQKLTSRQIETAEKSTQTLMLVEKSCQTSLFVPIYSNQLCQCETEMCYENIKMNPDSTEEQSDKIISYQSPVIMRHYLDDNIIEESDVPFYPVWTVSPDLQKKSIEKWTIFDVFNFITAIRELSFYREAFVNQEIDGMALTLVTDDELKKYLFMQPGEILILRKRMEYFKSA